MFHICSISSIYGCQSISASSKNIINSNFSNNLLLFSNSLWINPFPFVFMKSTNKYIVLIVFCNDKAVSGRNGFSITQSLQWQNQANSLNFFSEDLLNTVNCYLRFYCHFLMYCSPLFNAVKQSSKYFYLSFFVPQTFLLCLYFCI